MLKIWKTDGAKEFCSHELESVVAEKGIKHQISLPYAHPQQGVAERVNRTLMTKVCALMNQSGLPKKYWPYAMNHAVHLHNLLSTTANRGNLSPHMKWTGSRGDTSMLRVWGCMVQYRPTSATIGKFTHRARYGVHLGLSHEYKGWLILDIDTNQIVPARDILFYEQLTLKQWIKDERHHVARAHGNTGRSFASPEDEAAAAAFDSDLANEHPGLSPRPCDDDDDDNDDAPALGPLRSTNVSDLQLLGLHTSVTTLTLTVEPKNPQQALTGPHAKEWHAAMDAELKALESRDTWVVRHGIDFDQTFAPVGRHTSVRILLAVFICTCGCNHLRGAATHLRGRRPQGLSAEEISLRDKASAASLAAAPAQNPPRNRLQAAAARPGIVPPPLHGDYILLTVYVNDLLYTGTCNKFLNQFEENLAQRVDITINHNVTQFLGLNITYASEAIHLSTSKYAEQLGERFNISPAPLSTPYRNPSTNYKPDNKPLSPAGLQMYHQTLGCLLFASVTCRPDLSYISSQLTQYSRKPVAENQLDLERALQYFISTPDFALSYSTQTTTSFNLNGYVDADHAADPTNRRSRTGFVFRLEPTRPISWNSQKQEPVAVSSAEAEYIAATAAVRE
ncbi:unnamed protein product [Closterium sp. NIES-54]